MPERMGCGQSRIKMRTCDSIALRSHAAELQTCPTGAVQQIPTRLDLSRAGTVRAVAFDSSEPLPRELSECVRTRVLTWKFDEIELPADLEALVTLELR